MKDFFTSNRKEYLSLVQDNSISIFHSGIVYKKSADEDFDFDVDKNFYYLTGIIQSNVVLVMTKINGETNSTLFLEKNDPVLVKWIGAKLEKEEAINLSGVDEVIYLDDNGLENYLDNLFNSGLTDVYYNKELDHHHFYNFSEDYINKLTNKYENINLLDGYKLVVSLRMYKKPYEIEQMKASIAVTKTGIEELMNHSQAGLIEYELESYFDYHLKNNGQRVTSFKTIAAGGVNATILHYSNNNSVLNDNELVLFDLGCRTNLYASDITRTFPVNGKFTKRQREVYEEVLNVNKKCIEYLKPGLTRKEFNAYADKLLMEACYRLGLIKEDKEFRNYYWHSIGHSLGLDTHDPSLFDEPFKEGLVYTVEPGLYIAEENIGIRIEDDVLVTATGSENLSKDIIKEVDDIEKFMNKNF